MAIDWSALSGFKRGLQAAMQERVGQVRESRWRRRRDSRGPLTRTYAESRPVSAAFGAVLGREVPVKVTEVAHCDSRGPLTRTYAESRPVKCSAHVFD